jgi:hypothetical protein
MAMQRRRGEFQGRQRYVAVLEYPEKNKGCHKCNVYKSVIIYERSMDIRSI